MILENERQIGYLDRVLQRGRLAHAYLFYGSEQVGLAVAKAVAKALHCPSYRGEASIAAAGDGCRDCAAIDADAHHEVVFLDLEHTLLSEKEERSKIPIEDIHEIRRRFSFAPLEGQWRIAIIGQADKMSRDAADAFLKLLEEPGERTLFLLVTSAHELLQPTIISRAVPIRFSAAAGERTQADEKIRTAVRDALSRGIPEALALAEKIAPDREMRLYAIHALLTLLRPKLYAALPLDRLRMARHIGRVLDLASAVETTNVNPRLALDVMLIESISRS